MERERERERDLLSNTEGRSSYVGELKIVEDVRISGKREARQQGNVDDIEHRQPKQSSH